MAAQRKKKLPALNINAKAKSADPERDSFGINSPKTQVLADPAQDTPADNKLRSVVNSPKAGEDTDAGMSFQNAQPAQSDALASLVTQVERPDPSKKEATTTQKEETKPKRKSKKKSGWCCGCFSPSGDPLDDLEESPNKAVELENSGGKPKKPMQQTSGSGSPDGESQEDIRREEQGLLGRRKPQHRNKKCLVIDLDETLVHSSFKAVDKCDFIVPVEIENVVHNVYVLVRPYANEFLVEAAKHYEIVLFTASLAKYADPLLDLLDKEHTIDARLFRDSCVHRLQLRQRLIKAWPENGRSHDNRQLPTELSISALQRHSHHLLVRRSQRYRAQGSHTCLKNYAQNYTRLSGYIGRT